jgi:hypothetical protein
MTHTRTHVYVEFANLYLDCEQCHQQAKSWHDPQRCGCDEKHWNMPCGHIAGALSVCPSWGPVDGCTCVALFGYREHELRAEVAEADG